jgi:tetratricopeptide (TPR) repeat protein
VFKFVLFLNLLLFSINSFGVECNKEQESTLLKNKVFLIPSDCILNKGVMRLLKYQHALAYGHTDIVEEIIDSSFWGNVLDIDSTYEKIHLYNLHGKYSKALDVLEKINPNTTDKAYILALSETYLKVGDITQADNLFQKIESSNVKELPSPQYIMLHLELLYYRMDYQSLKVQANEYASSIIETEGTGVSGYDSNIVAWFVIGLCLNGGSEVGREDDVKFLRNLIALSYSKDSIFYQEQERIIGMCK